MSEPGQADNRHGIGGNFPPDPLSPDTIIPDLCQRHAGFIERVSDIDVALAFKLPAAISSQEEAERVAEFTVQCRKAEQDADAQLATELQPYSGAVEAVKGFFGSLRKSIQAAKEAADSRILAWNALNREKAAAEAWRPHAAEALIRFLAGQPTNEIETRNLRHLNFINHKGLITAVGHDARERHLSEKRAAEERAVAAAKGISIPAPPPTAAMPPPPPPTSIVRSSRGATAGERVRYKAVVVDEEKVPREFCSSDQTKLNAKLRLVPKDKDGKPIIDIPGVEIQEIRGITARGV